MKGTIEKAYPWRKRGGYFLTIDGKNYFNDEGFDFQPGDQVEYQPDPEEIVLGEAHRIIVTTRIPHQTKPTNEPAVNKAIPDDYRHYQITVLKTIIEDLTNANIQPSEVSAPTVAALLQLRCQPLWAWRKENGC